MGEKQRTISEAIKQEELADIEVQTKELSKWIEQQLGEKLPKSTLRESLMDGVFLCKLVNSIKQFSVKRYHRRPKMMAMKIENIGFFLAACTSRFNLPQAMLFAPMDLHEDKDNVQTMRKVLGVLLHLKNESGGAPAVEGGSDDIDNEAQSDANPSYDADPTPTYEAETPAYSSYGSYSEPDPEPEYDNYTEPEPDPVPETSYKQEYESAYTSEVKSDAGDVETYDWYIEGRKSDYIDVQSDVLEVISNVINKELSLESKMKLVEILDAHINALEQKVIHSSDDELRVLAHEMGLGKSLGDVPKKGREWNLEFIFKHGKAQ